MVPPVHSTPRLSECYNFWLLLRPLGHPAGEFGTREATLLGAQSPVAPPPLREQTPLDSASQLFLLGQWGSQKSLPKLLAGVLGEQVTCGNSVTM